MILKCFRVNGILQFSNPSSFLYIDYLWILHLGCLTQCILSPILLNFCLNIDVNKIRPPVIVVHNHGEGPTSWKSCIRKCGNTACGIRLHEYDLNGFLSTMCKKYTPRPLSLKDSVCSSHTKTYKKFSIFIWKVIMIN